LSAPASPQQASSASADDAVVDVRDVHYAIDGRPIFAGLNISVRRGLITAVMGPSGTGKTTLLRLITGQLFADSGQVSVFGRDIDSLSRSEIYATRKRMGMLFQNGALLTDSTSSTTSPFQYARTPTSRNPWSASWCSPSSRRWVCAVRRS
jgi:phospholipid/cholesterol/gamma-HCH transport system ATP-binding protein